MTRRRLARWAGIAVGYRIQSEAAFSMRTKATDVPGDDAAPGSGARPGGKSRCAPATTENGAVMSQMSQAATPAPMPMHGHASAVLLRSFVIGLTAFLTVVDLFATQAILPSLTRAYG